jgi:Arc/MetJ-type ribon-helix-helix transcriptional regulator
MVALPGRSQQAKPPDSEKLTVNLGFVDLGSIDLLVRDGFYSNRSDFIRTAIRNQLAIHADTAKQAASRLTLELGLRTFARQDLEAIQAAGERLKIRVLGLGGHRRRRDARSRPGHHRIDHRPRRVACVRRNQDSAGRSARLIHPDRNKQWNYALST